MRLEYLHPSRVVERVTNGEAELGLLSFPRKWPDLNVITWREEPMVLTVHPSHPFAGRPSITVAELDGEPFVALRSGPVDSAGDRPLSASSRRSSGRRARVRQHREHQARGRDPFGYFHPPRAVAGAGGQGRVRWPRSRSKATDPSDRITRPLAIIHRRQAILEPAAAKFLELLIGEDVLENGPGRRRIETRSRQCCALRFFPTSGGWRVCASRSRLDR